MTEDQLLKDLNPAQQEAVQHKEGPLLVLAGPGSGKTRVVTHRVAWLLEHGVRDYQIAALTFTNKAASEMQSRLAALTPGNRVWMGTFHRFCAHLLRLYAPQVGLRSNYTIYDTEQSRKLLENIVDKKELPPGIDVARISAAISWAKNQLTSSDDYVPREGNLLGDVVREVYPKYQEALRQANAVDFDDLLFHVAVLLQENEEVRKQLDYRFRYILVDEYQDTNRVQYHIARALSFDYPNLAVTGDPDQSIYAWRGADIRNILEFEKDFPNAKVVMLEQNYRSTPNILRVASQLIQHNELRKDKKLYTDNEEGIPPRILRCFNHREEAEVIAAEIASEISRGIRQPRDYAIFYRMNALSRNLEHALYRYGIPFQLIRGLEFFNRKEIKDILAYMQLVYNANDTIAFQRVINLPARGIGRVSLGRLTSFAALEGISLMEAARHVQKIPGIPIRTKKAVEKFVALIDRLGEVVVATNLETMLSVLLAETKYTAGLQESKTEEDGQRLANVQELLSEVREFDRSFDEEESRNSLASPPMAGGPSPENFDRLGRFLEKSALVSDVDTLDDQMNSVSLMTFHAAKGLEFPVVYLVAIEDNIIPHERSGKIQAQIEEERRLLFVGMTRAKEELRLSRTQFRDYRGMYTSSLASRFLFDITGDALQQFDSPDEMNSELLAPKESVSQLENRESEGRQEEYDEIPVYRQLETAGNNDSIPVSSEIPEKIPEWNGFGKGISVLKKSSQILSLSDYLEKVPDDFQGGASVFRDGRTLSDETTDFPAERDLRFDFHARNQSAQGGKEPRQKLTEKTADADEKSPAKTRMTKSRKSSAKKRRENNGSFMSESEKLNGSETDFKTDEPYIVYEDEGNEDVVFRKKRKNFSQPTVLPSAIKTGLELISDGDGGDKVQQTTPDLENILVVGMAVRHANYGIGFVKLIEGPRNDRVATVEFLSAIGTVDIPLCDKNLKVVAMGKKRSVGDDL